jgi:hypothetical protein
MTTSVSQPSVSKQGEQAAAITQPALRMPLLVILGVIFWFAAAMIIRFFGPIFFASGNAMAVLAFVLTLPIAFAFVWLGLILGGAKGAAALPAIVVMSFVAMLLDGIALTFFPTLYGPTYAIGGAWILWGLGLIQLIVFAQSRRLS